MNNGYINEGGQLKSKNGQKYVINTRRPSGVFVPRYCIIITVLLALAAMIAIALLSYFLLSQSSGTPTSIDVPSNHTEWRPSSSPYAATNDTNPDKMALAGFNAGVRESQTTTTELPATTTALPATTAGAVTVESIVTVTADALLDNAAIIVTEPKTPAPPAAIADEIIVQAEGWSPELYQLHIEPDFQRSVSNGSVAIAIVEDQPANRAANGWPVHPIVLDINRIDIERVAVSVNASGVQRPLAIEAAYGPRNESYVVRILDALPNRHDGVTVRLDFVSRLSDTLTGFYKTAYRANGVEYVMASTQFSPVDARRAFPCFDRPAKKARFEISVVRHANYTMALSNMPSIRTSYPRPGYVREDFDVTPRMSTYLVAFVVSNLQNASVAESIDAPNLPKIRMWTRPQYTHQTQFVYTMTTRMLSFLDRYFGIPFGLPKIDLVAVPDFGFSAMENYGLITFRESGLLVPALEEQRAVFQTRSVCKTLAHEIAHQWFGNLVTMGWWNDLWLKEGFATYLSYVTLQTVEPSWSIMDYFAQSELQRAMQADSDESAHPISFPVQTSADIRRMFDPISYSKGATVVGMLNGILGDQAFRASLRTYLLKYRFANADQDDLWAIMTEQAQLYRLLPDDLDVKTIMDTWTLQAGYPVLLVQRDQLTGSVRLTQQRYRLPKAADGGSDGAWYIPITFESRQVRTRDTRPTHWLRPEAGSDGLLLDNVTGGGPNDWLYANIRRIGYYRVNYDHRSWLALSRNFYDLPPVTQGALLDDSLALARSEQLTYDVPLTLLLKMATGDQDTAIGAVPWAAAERGVQFLSDMLSREPANGYWRVLMKFVLKPMFDKIDGFQASEDDTHVQKSHRVRVVDWACFFGEEKCVKRAMQLFVEWMRNADVVSLSPDLQSTILCTTLRHGGAKEWQFVYDRYRNATTAAEKEVFLGALGCTAKPWLLSRYLNMTLSPDSGIRKQDGLRAFSAVAKNALGNELAFNFLTTNIERFSEYFGEGFSTISRMIESTTTFANMPTQLDRYTAFADNCGRLGLLAIEKSVRLLLAQVRNNVYWRQHRYDELHKFLQSLTERLRSLKA